MHCYAFISDEFLFTWLLCNIIIHLYDSKKFSILKKGIGIEGEKIIGGQKQVREWKQVKDEAKGSLYVE